MESIKEDIRTGKIKPGDKISSENQLANRFAVSRHTIRKALSYLEHDGVLVARHGQGTFCVETVRSTTPSHNIAVITTYISDYIFPRVIQGMDQVLTENGYSIILKNTGNSQKNEAKALEDILTKNIDGLIIEPSKSEIFCRHMNLYERLDKLGIPYVFLQGVYPQMKDKPSIMMDDVEGGYEITKYLLEMGHKNLIGIFKIDDIQGANRHKGYIKALKEYGIFYDADRVILYHTEDRLTKPAEALREMLAEKVEMDGIVCYNDQIAYEAIRTLNEMGIRVPEEVSVTGYDDSFIAEQARVKLTTIAHPKEHIGQLIAELLLEKVRGIDEKNSKVPRVIEPELIIRESTISRLKKKKK